MPRSKKLPTEEQLKKERQALEFRRAGMTYEAIADRLGYANKSVAFKLIDRALKRTNQGEAEDVRALEVDRLDRLQMGLWANAIAGDVASARTVIRLMERRSRLLGLDAPTKIDATVSLDEAQAAIIVGLLTAVLNELRLTPEQQTIAGEVIPRHLRAIEGGQAAETG
jgi:hypothetical protein